MHVLPFDVRYQLQYDSAFMYSAHVVSLAKNGYEHLAGYLALKLLARSPAAQESLLRELVQKHKNAQPPISVIESHVRAIDWPVRGEKIRRYSMFTQDEIRAQFASVLDIARRPLLIAYGSFIGLDAVVDRLTVFREVVMFDDMLGRQYHVSPQGDVRAQTSLPDSYDLIDDLQVTGSTFERVTKRVQERGGTIASARSAY